MESCLKHCWLNHGQDSQQSVFGHLQPMLQSFCVSLDRPTRNSVSLSPVVERIKTVHTAFVQPAIRMSVRVSGISNILAWDTISRARVMTPRRSVLFFITLLNSSGQPYIIIAQENRWLTFCFLWRQPLHAARLRTGGMMLARPVGCRSPCELLFAPRRHSSH